MYAELLVGIVSMTRNMTVTPIVIILVLIVVGCRYEMMTDLGTLNIATWNSRGFRAPVPYLRDLLAKNDVVAVCETWLLLLLLMIGPSY